MRGVRHDVTNASWHSELFRRRLKCKAEIGKSLVYLRAASAGRLASRRVNVGDNFSTTGHHTGADRCPLQGAITVSRYNSIYVNFCCIPHPIYGVCRTILCAKPSEQVYTRRLFCRGSRCRNSNPFRIGVNSMDWYAISILSRIL